MSTAPTSPRWLITFFYRQMPQLIDIGHLYLAVPPLYRLAHGGKMFYARDDEHRAEIMAPEFRANANVEVGRFKGLGEMMPAQLKETTMDPKKRTLLKLMLAGNVQPPPPTHCCVYRGGTSPFRSR